ncbi:MAG: NAD(FAD)-utilizing dehydrogenase [Bacillota bacterium]|nr:NAD(FAD)-utilizing dehydrogenase [Bacillota bacterium]
MLRIHEIKKGLGESQAVIPERIVRKLGVKGLEIQEYRLIKESIDARNKSDIKLVYSVDFIPSMPNRTVSETEKRLLSQCKNAKLETAPDMSYQPVPQGSEPMTNRPVIAGFGPCGMFAGLILAQAGYRPIILERGKPIEERVKDVERFWKQGILDGESNVQFGEGGAGLFSDGKLTTQIKDPRVRKVLEEFVQAGGPPDLLYKQKPHIGTDVLRRVVLSIRRTILEHGGEILFQSRLTGLEVSSDDDNVGTNGNSDKSGNKRIKAVLINGETSIATENLILAVGHSARDTFRNLYQSGVSMSQKPFSIGVRIEHPQAMIDASQYGSSRESSELGAADYKLSYRCGNGRGVYTFCMCPGGYVIGAASHEGHVVTNGMSYHDRGSALANSALLVDVRPEDFPDDHPLSGIDFQEKYEKLAFEAGGSDYCAPAQRVGDFLRGIDGAFKEDLKAGGVVEPEKSAEAQVSAGNLDPTYRPGVHWTELRTCLPEFAAIAMREAIPQLGRKLRGFDREDAVMTGVETRSSSPVRINRDEALVGNIEGLYPAGEGAGYAGGIMSAAVDGIKVAEEIIKKYHL